jgi:predicted transcriptional regulator
MSKAPGDCAWITVMNNVNVVAVASLADVSCVIMCEGATPDEQAAKKANDIGMPILLSDLPAFEIGQSIAAKISG